jgi:hypothetical protein
MMYEQVITEHCLPKHVAALDLVDCVLNVRIHIDRYSFVIVHSNQVCSLVHTRHSFEVVHPLVGATCAADAVVGRNVRAIGHLYVTLCLQVYVLINMY